MASAQFQIQVNGGGYGTAGVEASAAAGEVIDCRLASTEGVTQVEWEFHGTHDAAAVKPTFTLSGVPTGQIATFTLPAGVGQAWGITCKVNGGAAVTANAAHTSKSAVRVPYTNGNEPVFIGETNESSPTHYTVPKFNLLLSSVDGIASGTGDVDGPGSSTDNAIARFDGTTGKVIQNSTATLSDAGAMAATTFNGVAITTGGGGSNYLADDGTYKAIAAGVTSVFTRTGAVTAAASDYDASQVDNDSNVAGTTVADALNNLAQTNLAIWSPGVTDAPPIYGTLAAALTAVKAQVGPGAILMHPTTASAFATVASTTYDFDSRVSLYSINNRTLTFGDSAPLINAVEVGCLQDGFRLTLADGASATGTRLLEVSSNTLRPYIYNLTKSGTARRLVQFTGGTVASERGIIIGRNVTTTMTGDIYSDGKTAVTLRGHGHSLFAGSGIIQNSSAHGEDLEVILEDAQGLTESDLIAGWSTGSTSVTYPVHVFRQTGRVLGQVTSTASGAGTGGEGTWAKIPNTTASGSLTGGVTTGGVSNRLVIPSSGTGTYRLTGSATFEPTAAGGVDRTRHVRLAVSGTGIAASERSAQLNSATGFHESVYTEIIWGLVGTQYVELEYTGPDSSSDVSTTRMSLSVERIA